MNIQDKMRISSVKRWHIVAAAKEQTLADHTCRVMILAVEIADRLGLCSTPTVGISDKSMGILLYTALNHDMEEITKGDMPGHNKRPVGEDRLSSNEHEKAVKLADVLESYYFIHEYHIDRHGKEVAHHLARRWEHLISLLSLEHRSEMEMLQAELFEGGFMDA